MKKTIPILAFTCSLLFAAAALAEDSTTRNIFGADLTTRLAAYKSGRAHLVPKGEGQPFAAAFCASVSAAMPHAWDVQMIVKNTEPVTAGETLSLVFAIRDATGGGHMGVKLMDKAGKTLFRQEIKPDGVWRKALFSAAAASAYAPGDLTLILFFGQQRQESMIAEAAVLACASGGKPALSPELAALPEMAEARPVAAPAAPVMPAGPFVMPVLPPLDTNTPRFVIFKFDDLKGMKNPNQPVHGRFQRLVDYIESKGLKASFGIVANSFEESNPAYWEWISKHAIEKGGRFEFWFHGYDHAMNMTVDGKTCTAEFSGPSYDYQSEHFTKGCKLMQERVGFPFRTFGAAGNAVDATGVRVLEEHPEIKVWLFGKAQKESTKFVLTRSPELEHAVGKVSFDAFLKGYTARRTQTCVTLQGHPAMWSDEMFADFQHIVDLLQADGRIFLTPYEYYQRVSK